MWCGKEGPHASSRYPCIHPHAPHPPVPPSPTRISLKVGVKSINDILVDDDDDGGSDAVSSVTFFAALDTTAAAASSSSLARAFDGSLSFCFARLRGLQVMPPKKNQFGSVGCRQKNGTRRRREFHHDMILYDCDFIYCTLTIFRIPHSCTTAAAAAATHTHTHTRAQRRSSRRRKRRRPPRPQTYERMNERNRRRRRRRR